MCHPTSLEIHSKDSIIENAVHKEFKKRKWGNTRRIDDGLVFRDVRALFLLKISTWADFKGLGLT
jgi:hypothetical protein